MCSKLMLPAIAVLIGCGSATAGDSDLFQVPIRLTAGDAEMAKGTLYPSPELQDLDGDGQSEILIGDLFGRILFSRPTGNGASVTWSPLESLKSADGKDIKFDNW